jgi:3-dehydrosphinganine reductase
MNKPWKIRAWGERHMRTGSIDGGVIVITGASSGLGKALTERLTKRSAFLALVARDEGKLRAVKGQLEGTGRNRGKVEVFPCDVSQADDVDGTFEQIARRLGPPDILINSAGILREGYFQTLPRNSFREVMDINFFGTLYCIQAVLPFFKRKGGGRIVNISSMAGLLGAFGYTPYCSSKHAVVGLTHTLRVELKPQNVLFNLVCPTEFETPMVVELDKTRTPENRAMIHTIPVSTLDEVADAVIRGMERDQYLIIPGRVTRMIERVNRWFPGLSRLIADWSIRRTYRGPGSRD